MRLHEYSRALAHRALDNSDMYDTGLLTNQLRLVDLEEMYPFEHNVSVAYFPPYLSMFFYERGKPCRLNIYAQWGCT